MSDYSQTQREAWSSVAAGWRRWWRVLEAGAQHLNERLVEMAEVEPGARVLDVATGIGEPALTAARRVGPEGSVLATDLSPEMVALGRERAREAGLANVEFRELDLEELESGAASLPPAAFDAALCRWGLMLLTDPIGPLVGLRRALRFGAWLAAAVWGPAREVPFIALGQTVLRRELELPAPDPDAPGPLAMGAEGQLEEALVRSGWAEVSGTSLAVPMSFADVDEYLRFLQDVSSSSARALSEATPKTRERALAALRAAALEHAGTDGVVRFENRVWLAAGRA